MYDLRKFKCWYLNAETSIGDVLVPVSMTQASTFIDKGMTFKEFNSKHAGLCLILNPPTPQEEFKHLF